MKSAEIVKALRHCATVDGNGCYECPAKPEFDCVVLIKTEAADLIERLEKEKAALLEYVGKSAKCEQCANNRPQCDAVAVDCFLCVGDCPCKKCEHGSRWEWKGLRGEGNAVDC